MMPPPQLVDRFQRDLDTLIAPGARIGIAVSGGADSLALLLLAAAARPGVIEAATVDHALRRESAEEAEQVAEISSGLGVPHTTLRIDWDVEPGSGLQEKARQVRYGALDEWARESGLEAIATAHHLDDQAETLLMRLARGAGVRGLSAMRPLSTVPGSDLPLLRPLLGWRRSELEAVCAGAGAFPVDDPSNADDRFERVRVRRALGEMGWLEPEMLARSAANLACADQALDWAAAQEWERAVTSSGEEVVYRLESAPPEIRRRIVSRAIAMLGSEGDCDTLRGAEIDNLLATLGSGGRATLRGVLCTGGATWRFVPAPKRSGRARKSC